MTAPDWVETRRRLLAFVLPRVASRDDAEDVVQDVLARMARDLDTLREGDRLNAWAYQIARNAVADEHRRRGRHAAAFARVAYDLPEVAADPTGCATRCWAAAPLTGLTRSCAADPLPAPTSPPPTAAAAVDPHKLDPGTACRTGRSHR